MCKRPAFRYLAAASLAAASLFAMTGSALAAAPPANTASTTLPVAATVVQTCTISAPHGLLFGNYDPVVANLNTALDTVGQISVTCTRVGALSANNSAAAMTLGIDNGANASGTQRQMRGLQNGFLQYKVFQPINATAGANCAFPGAVQWTNVPGSTGLLGLSAAPSKLARLYNVCGTVPAGQDVSVDSYSDILNATLSF